MTGMWISTSPEDGEPLGTVSAMREWEDKLYLLFSCRP